MQVNEGTLDRAIRITVGVALLSFLVIGPLSGWGLFSLIGLVGIIPLITGITGNCLTYTLLGIDTRGRQERRAAAHS